MGERFQKASSAAKLPERPSETTDDMDYPMTDAEHMTECHDTSPAVASYSHFSGTNPAPLDGNDSNRGKKPITSKSPENPALDTYHYPTRRQGEHVFQENVPSGHALIHMGDYYGKDVVSKSGQGHFYVKNRPKDHTTAQFGNTDGETVQAIVRARLEHDRSEDSSCTTAVKEEI
ncbi:MAG: hypothetical protein M1821_004588 [Bathelium mastoideum]|nr:MAG: hypothetical protein M1821_004588 [Bathelium mastoideum]